jgi:type I restriction enzyme R subunit
VVAGSSTRREYRFRPLMNMVDQREIRHPSFTEKQEAFVEFVLAQYVRDGVDELALQKLSAVLKLMYHDAIDDAVRDLGAIQEIQGAFTGFQQYLYEAGSA